MLALRAFRPFLSFFVRKLREKLLVDGAAKSSLLSCRYVPLPYALVEDWIDKTTVFGAPYVIRSLLSRFLKGVAGKLSR